MLKITTLALAASSLALLGACGQPTTTAEDVPPASDSQVASTDDRATDRDDGLLENAGEAIDGAGDHVEESVNDATDDNPNTNP
jgi:hypothetical protein